MRRGRECGLFALALAGVLVFQFRGALAPGHYLYPMVVEDPAGRYSLLPWDMLAARLLHAGEFPLWNPWSGLGMPLFANLQSAALNPLKWPFYLFRAPRLLDLMVIARLVLAGTFTFALARALRRSPAAAALAGAAFALSGYFMKHANMVSVSSEIWLPLLLLLSLRLRSRTRLDCFLAAVLAFFFVLVGGNPEAAFYTILLDLLFILAMAGTGHRARVLLAAWVLPLAAGGLLAAAQGVSFVEYLGAGWHIHDPNLHNVAPHPPAFLASLVAPWLWGPAGSHPAQLVSSPYVGVTVLLLAVVGALHAAHRGRPWFFFTGCLVLLLGIIWRLPLLGLLTELPPFDRGGNPKFAMAGVTFCCAMLAARGLDQVRAGGILARKSAGAVGIVSAVFLIGGLAMRREGAVVPAGLFTPFVALAFSAGTIVFCLRRLRDQRSGHQGAGALPRPAQLLVAAAILELAVFYYGYRRDSAFAPEMLRADLSAPPAALAPVLADPDHPRFIGMAGALHPNLNLLFGAADLRAFDGLYPANYVAAMGQVEGFGPDRAVENFFSHGWKFDVRPQNLGKPLLDRMGVKYIVTREPMPRAGWELVREGDYRVYRNPRAWPPAWLEPVGCDRENCPRERVVAVPLLRPRAGRVEVEAGSAGRLVVADNHFPGWQATAGGQPARTLPAGAFRSLDIAAGNTPVIMTYRPWGFRMGLWCSLTALAAFVAIASAGRMRP